MIAGAWGALSRLRETLDLLDLVTFQTKIEHVEIGPHVVGIRGPGQGDHADLEGKPEDNLTDGPAVPPGQPRHFGTSHRVAVGCQQRKALVDDPVSGAELPHVTVPAPHRVTAILDEARP